MIAKVDEEKVDGGEVEEVVVLSFGRLSQSATPA